MKRSTLKREGNKWVSEKIITAEQLEHLLAKYPKRDPNFVIILFAILLTGIGFLTFIFSDWAQQPHFSRLLIIMIAIIALYISGNMLYKKQSTLLGVSFIILGYIVFGTGMFLGFNIYDVYLLSAWPFIVWSLVGLGLYALYKHKLLFTASIIITTVGQIYSGLSFASFNWLIFLVLIFGFGHFVYHRANVLYGYLFGLGFIIQMLVLTMAEQYAYYWLIVFYLVLYGLSDLVPKKSLKSPLKYISLLGIFIFSIYQSLLLQDIFFVKELTFETGFIIVWILLILLIIILKVRMKQTITLIDLVLFLPLVYLPFSAVLTLISMFIFSIAWLFIGYRTENNEKIILGTIAFLLSTFSTYIQYAWDTMNKSLFFLVGGLLLFVISFALEKQRRTIISQDGDDHK